MAAPPRRPPRGVAPWIGSAVLVVAYAFALFLIAPILGPLRGLALHAQQGVGSDLPVMVAQGEAVSAGITPGGAFLRSLLVPGWGHVATESYSRAGFYVTAQSGSAWMLFQTLERRDDAEIQLRIERDRVRARLEVAGVADSLRLQRIDSDPEVERRQELVDARDDQVEDWVALSIFLALLGATDAFVAAHLADFPEPLSFDVVPGGRGGADLRVSFPIGP